MSNRKYKTEGNHIVLDIWFKEWQDNMLPDFVTGLAKFCGFEILQDMRRIFKPQGITYLAVLNESHLAIHTYPEHNYISLDLYTCGNKPTIAFAKEFVRQKYNTVEVKATFIRRGAKPSNK